MAITINSKHISLIVFLCSLIVLICMIVCLTSSYWVTAEQFRQGLLYLCIEPGYPIKPRPFGLGSLAPGCYPNRDVGMYHTEKEERIYKYVARLQKKFLLISSVENSSYFWTSLTLLRLHQDINVFVPDYYIIYGDSHKSHWIGIVFISKKEMDCVQNGHVFNDTRTGM